MFRIEFFVDDRNLPDTLRAVTGRAIDLKVLPVVNANIIDNKPVQTTNGSMLELFAQHLASSQLQTVVANEVKTFLASIGRSPNSSFYLLESAVKAGLLKRTGPKRRPRYIAKPKLLEYRSAEQ